MAVKQDEGLMNSYKDRVVAVVGPLAKNTMHWLGLPEGEQIALLLVKPLAIKVGRRHLKDLLKSIISYFFFRV